MINNRGGKISVPMRGKTASYLHTDVGYIIATSYLSRFRDELSLRLHRETMKELSAVHVKSDNLEDSLIEFDNDTVTLVEAWREQYDTKTQEEVPD